MPEHFLEVEGGGFFPTVVCTAAPGAPCRMVCVNPGCEEGCRCDDPLLKDIGECNGALWLNADDTMECGTGITRLPIDIEWSGDSFGWTFK